MKKKKPQRNFVAKNAGKFNKNSVQPSKKFKNKHHKVKHKHTEE